MTLWDAYRLANRRRASLAVTLDDGRPVRVGPRLVNGNVSVRQGLTASPRILYVDPDEARTLTVTRPQGGNVSAP